VRIVVDLDTCAVTGGCAHLAPDVFEVGDDGFLHVLAPEPPPESHADVVRAAELCPTGAITLSD
jgi:ferredoxin